eukprot:2827314-Rhodomonas_salina.1
MQFSGYEWLAKPEQAMQSKKDFNEAVFSWIFFLFAWNLILRGRNVGKLMYEHISWHIGNVGSTRTSDVPHH